MESGKGREGQQERILQVHKQQKEEWGKHEPAAEQDRGSGGKGHRKG